MSGDRQPRAWMRRWAYDGEIPAKERKGNGRMAWPYRFKLHPVTIGRCLPDDVPLFDDEPSGGQIDPTDGVDPAA